MNELIKTIRQALGFTQEELAKALNVSFSTVNRWENGRALPSDIAQSALFALCQQHGIDAYAAVMDSVSALAAGIELPPDRRLLFHGSKVGIDGPIRPISRDRCDFGRGFYLGSDASQALTLIADIDGSKLYLISAPTGGLTTLELPANLDWAMLVAFNRGKMDVARGTALYDRYAHMLDGVDMAIGAIADDRMFFVLDSFFQGTITDAALVASLSALSLGNQYVALTERACDALRIEAEMALPLFMRLALSDAAAANRERGIALANDICREHRREGLFFDEILEREALR